MCLHFLLGSTDVWQSYREALLSVVTVRDKGTVNPLLLCLLLSPGKMGWHEDCGSGQSDQGTQSRDEKLRVHAVEQLSLSLLALKIKAPCILVVALINKSKILSGFKGEYFSLVVESGIKIHSDAYESSHLKHLKELRETITVTFLFNGLVSNTSF